MSRRRQAYVSHYGHWPVAIAAFKKTFRTFVPGFLLYNVTHLLTWSKNAVVVPNIKWLGARIATKGNCRNKSDCADASIARNAVRRFDFDWRTRKSGKDPCLARKYIKWVLEWIATLNNLILTLCLLLMWQQKTYYFDRLRYYACDMTSRTALLARSFRTIRPYYTNKTRALALCPIWTLEFSFSRNQWSRLLREAKVQATGYICCSRSRNIRHEIGTLPWIHAQLCL